MKGIFYNNIIFISFIDEKKSIDIVAMSCVFSGPPRSGKTTVVKRLKGQKVDVKQLTPSTGILDERGTVRLDIVPSCNIVTDQYWAEMEEDDEVQAFLNLTIIPKSQFDDNIISKKSVSINQAENEENYEPVPESKPSVQKLETSVSLPTEPQQPESVVTSMPSIKHDIPIRTVHTTDHLPSPRDVLHQAQVHSQQIRATKRLCKRHFLHLTDTGGQPELRKSIPLLIPGPSITFIVFRLTDKIEKELESKLCLPTDREVNTDKEVKYEELKYGSYYCIKDTIEDIIQNIYCQELHSKIKSSIMFIGTHKDKLPQDPATRKHLIDTQNKEIEEILKQCPHYDDDMIVKSADNQVIFAVDNSKFDNEHKFIRSSVLSLCESDKFKVQVMPEQLLLALTLRGAKRTIMSMKDCIYVAKQCGIEEHEVRETLSFLQEKMMMIRVFRIENETIVVVKPKVLTNKVSMILKNIMERRVKDQMCHPVISYDELETIAKGGSSEESIESSDFTKILQYLLIIAPVSSSEGEVVTHYIVPSMLQHSLSTARVTNNTIPTILTNSHPHELLFSVQGFKFSIPSTLHSLVMSCLIQNEQWNIAITECSKTCTLFSSREYSAATFQIKFFKEGISLSLKQDWNGSTQVIKHCINAKNTVSRAIQKAFVLVGYGTPIALNYHLNCLKQNCIQVQNSGGSFIDHDCMTSHFMEPNIVWFSEVRHRKSTAQS